MRFIARRVPAMFFHAVLVLLSVSAIIPAPAAAQLSKPEFVPAVQTIAPPRDIAFPGVMRLTVDASDRIQGVFKITQIIPVPQSGRMTLLYPQWLPGNHAPRGEIEKLANLQIFAGDTILRWRRDPVDVFAFHIDVPEGVPQIRVQFQFVSATASNQGRVVVTPKIINLRWHQLSLYPAGYYTRRIKVDATAIYPEGWDAASALRPKSKKGSTFRYKRTDYDTLIDSPVFASKLIQKVTLTPHVNLNIVADHPKYFAQNIDHLSAHARLVREAQHLFRSRPFDRYDFLLALSDELGGIGIEHHRSSENAVAPEYFTQWDRGPGRRNLLPHELVHSWIGKYRRPVGMWAPDFRQPLRNELLWVYEGQTQFWGYVLGARSGLFSKQDTLDAFASLTAGLDRRVGRNWRPLSDTTLDPIISARRPKPWTTWQRNEDYYNEGLLIWLEIDMIIRRATGGRKSLENFARRFFKGRDGDYGVKTFTEADVINMLNRIAPYDWRTFIDRRVYQISREAPKQGLELGGYRLVYKSTPSRFTLSAETRRKRADLSHSIGLWVDKNGAIKGVAWDSPAFAAGLKTGMDITSVNGKAYTTDLLKLAIEETRQKASNGISLLIKNGENYQNILIDYSGGLRYPHLEKINPGENGDKAGIDLLLKAQVKGP